MKLTEWNFPSIRWKNVMTVGTCKQCRSCPQKTEFHQTPYTLKQNFPINVRGIPVVISATAQHAKCKENLGMRNEPRVLPLWQIHSGLSWISLANATHNRQRPQPVSKGRRLLPLTTQTPSTIAFSSNNTSSINNHHPTGIHIPLRRHPMQETTHKTNPWCTHRTLRRATR